MLLVKCESPFTSIVSNAISDESFIFCMYHFPFVNPLMYPVICRFLSDFFSAHATKINAAKIERAIFCMGVFD